MADIIRELEQEYDKVKREWDTRSGAVPVRCERNPHLPAGERVMAGATQHPIEMLVQSELASEAARRLYERRIEDAKTSLITFAQTVDPGAAAEYGARHLRYIASYLERVESGEIKRLIISTPPRHWKSSLTSEKFVAWYLGRNPERTIIATSYSASLVEGFSRNIKDNIVAENKMFHKIFPDCKLIPGQRSVEEWSLVGAYRSTYRARGTGSAITGLGANLILIDDPVSGEEQMRSRTQRDYLYEWYKNRLRTRLEPGGAIVIIATRWHHDDLIAKVLRQAKDDPADDPGAEWIYINLPAVCDEKTPDGKKYLADPLDRPRGEALWPERWDIPTLRAIRKEVGIRAFTTQYQGHPTDEETQVIDTEKFIRISAAKVPHKMARRVRHWDLAFSDKKGADRLSGAKLSCDEHNNVYIWNIKTIEGRWPKAKPKIIDTALDDGLIVQCSIEANGPQLGYYQEIKDDPRMLNRKVIKYIPEGTKESRAEIWASYLQEGKVFIVVHGESPKQLDPRDEWIEPFLQECEDFPAGQFDDRVDGVSGGWSQLPLRDNRTHVSNYITGDEQDQLEEDEWYESAQPGQHSSYRLLETRKAKQEKAEKELKRKKQQSQRGGIVQVYSTTRRRKNESEYR